MKTPARSIEQRERTERAAGRRRRTGQTSTEYMLVVSVLVIAAVAASYGFIPRFRTGVHRLGSDVHQMLSTGEPGRPGAATKPTRSNRGFDYGCGSGIVCNPAPAGSLGAPPELPNACRVGENC